MNGIAYERLKGFEPKFAQILPTLGPRTQYVLKVMGAKVKVTETFSAGGVLNDRSPSTVMLQQLSVVNTSVQLHRPVL